MSCLLPDGAVVDIETCKGWRQESAYQNYRLQVEEGWVRRKFLTDSSCLSLTVIVKRLTS
jgi:hypothetical protein